jgi:predicted  nucleic acid-binding Zn-ribbon protein
MDDRRKQIKELEKRRNENQAACDTLLEGLGESLFARPQSETVSGIGEIEEYRRLRGEIAAADVSIKDLEVQIARLRNLDEEIEAAELGESARSKDLTLLYARLGKLLLEDPDFRDFSAPYQDQAGILIPKLKSIDDRLSSLADKKDAGNVFTWIGKSAQGMVLKSFQAKAQENLDRLYRDVGEQFARLRADKSFSDLSSSIEIAELGAEIEKNKGLSQTLLGELATLKEERMRVNEELNSCGGPLKKTQKLRALIGQLKIELQSLYRHFGAAAYRVSSDEDKLEGGESSLERAGFIESLLAEVDREVLDRAGQIKRSISDDEAAIRKLEASLAIETHMDSIEKFRRAIAEKKVRISDAELAIAEFEKGIREAENQIEELRKLL